MFDWLGSAAAAPILAAGIPTEWGTLLAILVLLAVQTALAYRRGKVEPLPPGGAGGRRSPAPTPVPPTRERPGVKPSEGAAREIGRAAEPARPSEFPRRREEAPSEEGAALPSPWRRAPSVLPRYGTAAKVPRPALRRLRNPAGAREAFLGAEILWKPPAALREPDDVGG